MTEQQKKMAAKIKALLAKTTENGATEAEAFEAMAKARQLMDKHGLTKAQIELDAETIGKQSAKRDNYKTFVIKDWLALEIAKFCDCMKKDEQIVFYGTEQDRQFAIWLIESMDLFVRNQTIAFMETKGHKGGAGPWDLQKGFMTGCISRINERLRKLSEERQQAARPNGRGTSLVVIKMQLVNQAFAQIGLNLRSGSRSNGKRGDGSAFAAGRAAGDKANFSRPINGGAGVQSIAKH
jgi:hypothetical protein